MKPKTEIAHITTPVAKYILDLNTGVIKAKPIITRGDSIRSMTDEELAEFFAQQEYRKPSFDGWLPLCNHVMGPKMCDENGCEKCWLDWLKEEASE